MAEQNIIQDIKKSPIFKSYNNCATDWDEIKWWTDQMYMPYTLQPIGQGLAPKSSMQSIVVGEMIVTRFKYGIPVHLHHFDQSAGNILLLTTLQGKTNHAINPQDWCSNNVGDSFLVDCSQNDNYELKTDAEHLQLNLTIPHKVLADLVVNNFGQEAPIQLWQCKTFMGGQGSSWLMLLRYLMQSIAEISESDLRQRAGEHLQQMVCLHILNEWASRAKIDLSQKITIAPRYVLQAEQYMQEYLHLSPTIVDIAKAVGVSIRTLSSGFKKFRQKPPSESLRQMRLQRVHHALLQADRQQSVADIAYALGYINLGDFARQYRKKYGELPSETLRK